MYTLLPDDRANIINQCVIFYLHHNIQVVHVQILLEFQNLSQVINNISYCIMVYHVNIILTRIFNFGIIIMKFTIQLCFKLSNQGMISYVNASFNS